MSQAKINHAVTFDAMEKRASNRALVVGLLTTSFAIAFMDRSILNLLLDPIKKDFALSDTVLGLIAGFGFVVLYAVLGLFVGRLADRHNRVSLLSIAMVFWSVMTSATAFAGTLIQLTLFRLGVAAGEAALQGPAQSLIADHFPSDTRARPLAVYSTGPYLGILFGFLIAGWISQYYGWRTAFFAAGLPGIFVAIALYTLVREPVRGAADPPDFDGKIYSFGDTLSFLLRQPSFVLCIVAFCLTSYTNFALGVWVASFLRRVHHLSSAEVGTYAGTIQGLVGVAGGVLGGYLVTTFKAEREDWRLKLPALASLFAGPILLIFFFVNDLIVALLALMVGVFLTAIHVGPVYAAVQSVAKVRMRSFASSALLLGASFFGSGVAPLAIGFFNDTFAATLGDAAIRYSLASSAGTSMLGAMCLWYASRWLAADARRAAKDQIK